jgi:ribosomal subunit interface protein
METPIRFTYRHADSSAALEANARELCEHLQRFHDHIINCHVVVEGPSRHHRNRACTVKVELTIPGAYIHADSSHESMQDGDTYLALRSAFENAKRQLQQGHRRH